MPRYKPPKWRERNAARLLFGTGLADVEIARRVGASPRSVGRWRRAWESGTDWSPPAASSFGVVAGVARRIADHYRPDD